MFAEILLIASFLGFLKSFIFVVFVVVALLLVLVVLLQEPKGGGLSGAFGGVGAETFGVQTGGVNKFTSVLAGLFLVLALMYAAIPDDARPSASQRERTFEPTSVTEPTPADDGKAAKDDEK